MFRFDVDRGGCKISKRLLFNNLGRGLIFAGIAALMVMGIPQQDDPGNSGTDWARRPVDDVSCFDFADVLTNYVSQ